jgi:hypothetical protein
MLLNNNLLLAKLKISFLLGCFFFLIVKCFLEKSNGSLSKKKIITLIIFLGLNLSFVLFCNNYKVILLSKQMLMVFNYLIFWNYQSIILVNVIGVVLLKVIYDSELAEIEKAIKKVLRLLKLLLKKLKLLRGTYAKALLKLINKVYQLLMKLKKIVIEKKVTLSRRLMLKKLKLKLIRILKILAIFIVNWLTLITWEYLKIWNIKDDIDLVFILIVIKFLITVFLFFLVFFLCICPFIVPTNYARKTLTEHILNYFNLTEAQQKLKERYLLARQDEQAFEALEKRKILTKSEFKN